MIELFLFNTGPGLGASPGRRGGTLGALDWQTLAPFSRITALEKPKPLSVGNEAPLRRATALGRFLSGPKVDGSVVHDVCQEPGPRPVPVGGGSEGEEDGAGTQVLVQAHLCALCIRTLALASVPSLCLGWGR